MGVSAVRRTKHTPHVGSPTSSVSSFISGSDSITNSETGFEESDPQLMESDSSSLPPTALFWPPLRLVHRCYLGAVETNALRLSPINSTHI
ncbi:hypothetical protein U1Q18_051027 [Sarracenia purpurea var. burkii]